jgi:hypothetical protein
MDKATFLANKQGAKTQVVPLPIGGGEVIVRGLTVAQAKESGEGDGDEALFMAYGMVQPEMTRDEMAEWLKTAPVGDYAVIVEAITKLSGTGKGAAKSGVRGVHKRRKG